MDFIPWDFIPKDFISKDFISKDLGSTACSRVRGAIPRPVQAMLRRLLSGQSLLVFLRKGTRTALNLAVRNSGLTICLSVCLAAQKGRNIQIVHIGIVA